MDTRNELSMAGEIPNNALIIHYSTSLLFFVIILLVFLYGRVLGEKSEMRKNSNNNFN